MYLLTFVHVRFGFDFNKHLTGIGLARNCKERSKQLFRMDLGLWIFQQQAAVVGIVGLDSQNKLLRMCLGCHLDFISN